MTRATSPPSARHHAAVLQQIRMWEARHRAERTGWAASGIAAALAGAAGLLLRLFGSALQNTGTAGGPLLEHAFAWSVLVAAVTGFRAMDILFRAANASALRHLAVRAEALLSDRASRVARETALLLFPMVAWVAAAAGGPETDRIPYVLGFLASAFFVIPSLGFAAVVLPASLVHLNPPAARVLDGVTQMRAGGVFHVAPGLGVGVAGAFLLFSKLGWEEPLRLAGPTGAPTLAPSVLVAIGIPVVVACVAAAASVWMWARHAGTLAALFEDADQQIDLHERVAATQAFVAPAKSPEDWARLIVETQVARRFPWMVAGPVGLAAASILGAWAVGGGTAGRVVAALPWLWLTTIGSPALRLQTLQSSGAFGLWEHLSAPAPALQTAVASQAQRLWLRAVGAACLPPVLFALWQWPWVLAAFGVAIGVGWWSAPWPAARPLTRLVRGLLAMVPLAGVVLPWMGVACAGVALGLAATARNADVKERGPA